MTALAMADTIVKPRPVPSGRRYRLREGVGEGLRVAPPLVTMFPAYGYRWATDARAVRAALPVLGVSVDGRLDGRWTTACVLPGHDGTAEVRRSARTGAWRYGCDCASSAAIELTWRSLANVRASLAHGEDVGCLFTGKARALTERTWFLRLGWEAGLPAASPRPVDLPELPAGSRRSLERVRDGFALLCGLRWRFQEEREVAFTARWTRAWCRDLSAGALQDAMTVRTATEAIRDLQRAGVIELVRVDPHPRPTRYFVPGGSR